MSLKFDNKPLARNVKRYLINYLAKIRDFDWCHANGTKAYEESQNKVLQQFKKKYFEIMIENNPGNFNLPKVSTAIPPIVTRKPVTPIIVRRVGGGGGKGGKGGRGGRVSTGGNVSRSFKKTVKKHHHDKKHHKHHHKKHHRKFKEHYEPWELTPSFFNSLDDCGNIELFVLKEQGLLLAEYREQQKTQQDCQCLDIFKYLKDENLKLELKNEFIANMTEICSFTEDCNTHVIISPIFEEFKANSAIQKKITSMSTTQKKITSM